MARLIQSWQQLEMYWNNT